MSRIKRMTDETRLECNRRRKLDCVIRGATDRYSDQLNDLDCIWDKWQYVWLAPSVEVRDQIGQWPGIRVGTEGPRLEGPRWPAWCRGWRALDLNSNDAARWLPTVNKDEEPDLHFALEWRAEGRKARGNIPAPPIQTPEQLAKREERRQGNLTRLQKIERHQQQVEEIKADIRREYEFWEQEMSAAEWSEVNAVRIPFGAASRQRALEAEVVWIMYQKTVDSILAPHRAAQEAQSTTEGKIVAQDSSGANPDVLQKEHQESDCQRYPATPAGQLHVRDDDVVRSQNGLQGTEAQAKSEADEQIDDVSHTLSEYVEDEIVGIQVAPRARRASGSSWVSGYDRPQSSQTISPASMILEAIASPSEPSASMECQNRMVRTTLISPPHLHRHISPAPPQLTYQPQKRRKLIQTLKHRLTGQGVRRDMEPVREAPQRRPDVLRWRCNTPPGPVAGDRWHLLDIPPVMTCAEIDYVSIRRSIDQPRGNTIHRPNDPGVMLSGVDTASTGIHDDFVFRLRIAAQTQSAYLR